MPFGHQNLEELPPGALEKVGWVSFKLQGRIPWARLRVLLHEAHLLAS
jgi:hypothetical protein